MKPLKMGFHALRYGVWLVGQILKESTVMAMDTLGTGRHIAPVVLYYPLRIRSETEIAAFVTSITMTPGTLALGLTGPKEVDYDAAAGGVERGDISAVTKSEFKTHGLDNVQRFLAVHAMYGLHPEELLASLADMEEHLAPYVKDIPQRFDVKHLVERGRPGPRGFRGSRGGRASDETVFDVEKVDSTPHAVGFVSDILRLDEEEKNPEDLKHMSREERYEVAARNAARNKDRTPAHHRDEEENQTDSKAANATRVSREQARIAAAREELHETDRAGTSQTSRKASDGVVGGVDKNNEFYTDIDTFQGDRLGSSHPDRQGRTKPGETLYDPLYPGNNPHEDDIDGTKKFHEDPLPWYVKDSQHRARKEKRRKNRAKKERRKHQ
ncbi:Na+/H+ antiporter subunit E [uncultured Corynebacterium sp.]|uniref:Na+/H+ antiporter subunit E n=1 Tax=uncultured Corynebacterium sp. TaxID=159447 RepID=UPI0025EC760C|nr:Na+/H+ antiporter subunit E [uncultured Corynebacterium sp.]